MTSVARKTHIPSSADARRCSGSTYGECVTVASNKGGLRQMVIGVGVFRHYRDHVKIIHGRRRGCFPFQSGRIAWVGSSLLSEFQRVNQIDERQEVSHTQDGCPRCGEDVQYLKLRWIMVIAARHPKVPKNKLWKECQVKSDEH